MKTQSCHLVVRTNWFVVSIKKELVLSKSVCASGLRVRIRRAAGWIGRAVVAQVGDRVSHDVHDGLAA